MISVVMKVFLCPDFGKSGTLCQYCMVECCETKDSGKFLFLLNTIKPFYNNNPFSTKVPGHSLKSFVSPATTGLLTV